MDPLGYKGLKFFRLKLFKLVMALVRVFAMLALLAWNYIIRRLAFNNYSISSAPPPRHGNPKSKEEVRNAETNP